MRMRKTKQKWNWNIFDILDFYLEWKKKEKEMEEKQTIEWNQIKWNMDTFRFTCSSVLRRFFFLSLSFCSLLATSSRNNDTNNIHFRFRRVSSKGSTEKRERKTNNEINFIKQTHTCIEVRANLHYGNDSPFTLLHLIWFVLMIWFFQLNKIQFGVVFHQFISSKNERQRERNERGTFQMPTHQQQRHRRRYRKQW